VHAERPQRTHGALEDSAALPQHPHSVLSNRLSKRQAKAFIFSMLKTNAAAWRSRHSAHYGDLHFFNAVGTL